MRKKDCDQESVFEYIWKHANADGLWNGDASTVAEEFGVTEDEAYEMLSELCDCNHLQRVGRREYIVVRWPERDGSGEEEATW
jgi:hypothetical protein